MRIDGLRLEEEMKRKWEERGERRSRGGRGERKRRMEEEGGGDVRRERDVNENRGWGKRNWDSMRRSRDGRRGGLGLGGEHGGS